MVRTMMIAVIAVVVMPGQTAPTLDRLKNATYKGIYDEPVTLTDGVYDGKPLSPVGEARGRVGLLPSTLVTGDLDGDSTPEAVVLMWKVSGGSGVFTYLAVAADKGGEIENIATALVGAHVRRIEGTAQAGVWRHRPR